MSNPIVAIIGRQNVGKSTLLNRLSGRQVAITEDLPGTTRDRVFTIISHKDIRFTLVDTGGLIPKPDSSISQGVNEQINTAIEDADLLLFLVDTKDGATATDLDIADKLRQVSKPLILVANKADNVKLEDQAVDFYGLGLGEPIVLSAYHGRGVIELLDRITALLPTIPTEAESEAIKVAIIGRANTGKSTLLNTLLGEERAIVDDSPGTTRDATDTPLDFEGQSMVLIDTAGIRRRGKVEPGVERYSVVRALRAIDRANIVLLLVDGAEMVTAQDTHIAGLITQAAKGIIIIVNKWDLVKETTRVEFTKIIRGRLKFAPYAPVVYISAKLGQGVDRIIPEILRVHQERGKRIATAEVNSMLKEALADHHPPRSGTRQLKILYATQAEVNPPTFTFFVNNPKLMHFSYQRFLENRLRASFGFDGTPLRMVFKPRREGQ
jgi:GTP-binding protein